MDSDNQQPHSSLPDNYEHDNDNLVSPSITPPTSQQSVTPNPELNTPAEPLIAIAPQSSPDVSQGPLSPVTKRKSGLTAVMIAAVVTFVLLGAGAAAYVGVILPNKPDRVWHTALLNTATGYDKLIDYSITQKDVKGVSFNGSYKFTGNVVADGTLKGSTYQGNTIITSDIGASGVRVNFESRALTASGQKNPDIYVKVRGVKGLSGLLGPSYDSLAPTINAVDNQWFVVDHTLLDQVEASALKKRQSLSSRPLLTSEDVTAIARAVGEVNRQYLWTDDQDKSVLVVQKSLGKISKDGRATYHFQTGVNKAHLKTYVAALKDKLKTTPVTKLLAGKNLEDAINYSDLLKSIDKINESDHAEVWVDAKTKLIRTVRFSNPKNTNSHLDVGLNYNGGDSFPFVVNLAGDKGETVNMALTLNTKTNVVDTTVDIESKPPKTLDSDRRTSEQLSGKVRLTFAPLSRSVTIEKPTGAKSLIEILGPLLGGFGGGSAGTSKPRTTGVNFID